MGDDKALDAARARIRLLEQTVVELRQQLASRPAAQAVTSDPRDSRGRRNSVRPPAMRAETEAETALLHAALETRVREVEAAVREREEVRSTLDQREREVQALRAERDDALNASRRRESDVDTVRIERDDARGRLRTVETERDQLLEQIATLETKIAAHRPKPKMSVRPPKRTSAEFESQNLRVQALERQLEALRTAWKASEDRAQGLETKLKQVRSVDTVAILKTAADRAGELARLLDGAATKLKDEPASRA